MNALFFGLTLAGAATAQVVADGVSMVQFNPNTMVYGAASSQDYAPPQASYTPPPAATYSAPPSDYTPPPSDGGFYNTMPYSSFTEGGYKSLECGYGYYKGSDGSCNPESWVCSFRFCASAARANALLSTRRRGATPRSSSSESFSIRKMSAS